MQKTPGTKKNTENTFGHAVVIGSGIAGLAAAQVLTSYFKKVTLVDRDEGSEGNEFRNGVPQARHAHTLLPLGQRLLEKLFPGLIDELMKDGAISIDNNHEVALFKEGRWRTPRTRQENKTISSSRPLLESAIYRRVAGNAKVHTMHGYQVTGLATDNSRQKIVGINIHNRLLPSSKDEFLAADLVLDASGRNSQAPNWLAELGYTPPEEWKVNSFAGYSTRIYKRPAGFKASWKKLYIRPNPPDDTRGGLILPMEDDRWHVTLIGEARDYPPTKEDDFLAFASSLPSNRLYKAIKDAEALSRPAGYRRTENRVRRYNKLPRYLEAFLVIGDAVYTLNPIFAQGMTAAAVGSLSLDKVLREQVDHSSSLVGLAKAFQQRLSVDVGRLWHSTVAKEWGWSATELDDNTEDIYPTEQGEVEETSNIPNLALAGV